MYVSDDNIDVKRLKEVFEGLGSFCVSTPSSSKWAIVVSSLLLAVAFLVAHSCRYGDLYCD